MFSDRTYLERVKVGVATSSLFTTAVAPLPGRGGHDVGLKMIWVEVVVTVIALVAVAVAVTVGLAGQYLPHAIENSAPSAVSAGQTLEFLSDYILLG